MRAVSARTFLPFLAFYVSCVAPLERTPADTWLVMGRYKVQGSELGHGR
jgi:hypothetical protein